MRTCWAFCLILLGTSLPCGLSAQELSSPEDLAGRWEASDGHGGQVGMNILISTTIASQTTNLVSVFQRLQSFEIGLYQRSGSDVKLLGYNFFTTSSSGELVGMVNICGLTSSKGPSFQRYMSIFCGTAQIGVGRETFNAQLLMTSR